MNERSSVSVWFVGSDPSGLYDGLWRLFDLPPRPVGRPKPRSIRGDLDTRFQKVEMTIDTERTHLRSGTRTVEEGKSASVGAYLAMFGAGYR